jgi:AdoMet-dependent heme synthase
MTPFDFNRTPFLVIWEVTRACALACVHCRADAIPRRNPGELSTAEGFRLIDQIRALGTPPPLFVLTGGDPMRRPDLAELVGYAAGTGLTVALTPSGTAAATPARLAALKAAGLSHVAVSLDGPTPETHDAFRRVGGSYAWTTRIIEAAIRLDLPLQINSTISKRTLPYLETLTEHMRELPVTLWALFFLIQTGRGAALEQISAEECERVLTYLYDLSLTAPFGIKTTEAPHYQRVVWQRDRATKGTTTEITETNSGHGFVQEEKLCSPFVSVSSVVGPLNAIANRRRQLRAPRSVGDGNGFVFVDHLGNICPSGFLPAPRGNVRTADLGEIYRSDDMFMRLRNANALVGKCGRCEFREICGGSRSRAFAATGAVMASDPLCVYDPGPVRQPIVTHVMANG